MRIYAREIVLVAVVSFTVAPSYIDWHAHVTMTERYLKFPREYLENVFGESVTPYPTRQLWADLSQDKPAFQA